MRQRVAHRGRQGGENPFWISYSDLMTALVIVFMLMVASALMDIHEKQEQREIVRRQIIAELMDKLQAKYKSVHVDPKTGSITISDGILFGFNETALTDQGKEFLKTFVPDYAEILLANPAIREHLAQIIVEGHADNVGGYNVNLEKSLGRAYAVSTYVLSSPEMSDFKYREELRQLLTTNGRSNMDPKPTAELSRRVEIKFQLKDWDIISTPTQR